MIDWLKKRLSPVKKDSPRWMELAESIQEFWAENFDPNYDVLAGLRSIYTADATNQRRLAVEMGGYFEDGISDGSIPVSVAMRKMELHQKETNVPLVRSMSRIGFAAEWAPLYAPRGEIYGTAFYTEDELEAAGLHIDAAMIRLDGSWHVGDDSAAHLTSDGVYMTSRAKMVLDLSSGRIPAQIDAARRRIMQIKPLHIVFDGFKYVIWLEISAIPTHAMHLRMVKEVGQHYPWCTPKLTGLWKIGTNITVHHHLDGTWKLNGVNIGSYLISGTVHKRLLQCTITGGMTLTKDIERPDQYLTARIGESLLKLDRMWRVGMNRILTLSGERKLRKSVNLDGAASFAFGSADRWAIQYPASPRKLGKLATLGWRRLDGGWKVGASVVRGSNIDGTWKILAPGVKVETERRIVSSNSFGIYKRLGEEKRLDGLWKVGGCGPECVSGERKLRKSVSIGGGPSLDFGSADAWGITYPANPVRLGRLVTVGGWRRLDGNWKIGGQAAATHKILDGMWKLRATGIRAEESLAMTKNIGPAGIYRKIGRYTGWIGGRGASRKLDGLWPIGAYHDLDGTWRLDGSHHRLGGTKLAVHIFCKLDGSWKVGEVTKRLDGAWQVGQTGPDCEMTITVRKAA